jgi:seryl-tRNA synthetase
MAFFLIVKYPYANRISSSNYNLEALIQYGTQFLFSRGFKPNQPPYMMNRDAMAKTAQLEQFDEELV